MQKVHEFRSLRKAGGFRYNFEKLQRERRRKELLEKEIDSSV